MDSSAPIARIVNYENSRKKISDIWTLDFWASSEKTQMMRISLVYYLK